MILLHITQKIQSMFRAIQNMPNSISLTTAISFLLFFFFNDTATTEIYTLSLHDALPIYRLALSGYNLLRCALQIPRLLRSLTHDLDRIHYILLLVRVRIAKSRGPSNVLIQVRKDSGKLRTDRKSTRLNSSHT